MRWTGTGRVVYHRKKHFFTLKSAFRVFNSISVDEVSVSLESFTILLQTLSRSLELIVDISAVQAVDWLAQFALSRIAPGLSRLTDVLSFFITYLESPSRQTSSSKGIFVLPLQGPDQEITIPVDNVSYLTDLISSIKGVVDAWQSEG